MFFGGRCHTWRLPSGEEEHHDDDDMPTELPRGACHVPRLSLFCPKTPTDDTLACALATQWCVAIVRGNWCVAVVRGNCTSCMLHVCQRGVLYLDVVGRYAPRLTEQCAEQRMQRATRRVSRSEGQL